MAVGTGEMGVMAPFGARLRGLAGMKFQWKDFGWGQFVVLAAVFICAGGLFTFARIMDEMMEGDTHAFDEAISSPSATPPTMRTPSAPSGSRS
jgi:undecaprenyl-diphosphatase